jgi:isopenicillin N synthase-like dioxygenase
MNSFDKLILDYMNSMTELGHIIMKGVAISLDLEEDYFQKKFTAEPFTPFRLFYYPIDEKSSDERWGVGEHTDYGKYHFSLQNITSFY